MYVNPIPTIGVGKKFEMRLELTFDELVDVDGGRQKCAQWLKEQPVDDIARMLHCVKIHPLYPNMLSDDEKNRLGLLKQETAV